VLTKIECVDVDGLTPLVRVKIVDCGMNIDINDYGSMASKNDKVNADNSNLSNGIASGGDNSEHKLRSYSRRSSKGRGSSISLRGPIKRPSIHPVESSRSTSPTRLPVESSRSTSPTRQSINMGLRERSSSRSPSRCASRSLDTPLSRSRSKNASSSGAQTRSFSGRSGSHLPRRNQNASPEGSPVQRRMSRSPSRRRRVSSTRSVSWSPSRRSKRRKIRSHRRSSGRSSVHSPTSHHQPRRSSSRGASPPCSHRARLPSPDNVRSLSRSGGSSHGSPKRIRKGRGFTRRYSFVQRYRSPTSNRLSVRSDHYGGRNNRERYATYQSSHYHRRYRSPSIGRASSRRRTRSRS